MTLAAQIAEDVEGVFLNTSDFAVSVAYKRGSHSVTFDALVSSTVFETSTEFGITRLETRDYSFAPANLVITSQVRLPERGDKIVEGGRTYIVSEPSGQPCYGYDDENRLMIRVHTVLAKDA